MLRGVFEEFAHLQPALAVFLERKRTSQTRAGRTLDDLDKQIPAMDAGLYINGQDQTVKKSQLSPEAKKVLSDYRMIMYDLSIGDRYSEKTMYENTPSS